MSMSSSFRMRGSVVWAILLVVAVGVASPALPRSHARSQSFAAKTSLAKQPSKLSWRLGELARADSSVQTSEEVAHSLSLAASGPGSLMRDADGAVLSYIRVADTSDATLATLRKAGAQITHVAADYRIVTAYITPDKLDTLAGVRQVAHVREALRPFVEARNVAAAPRNLLQQADCAPGVISEGDTQLKSADARAAFSLDGSGVTVGVLSDSYNNAPGRATNATSDIAAGDLPGPGNPCERTTPISVLAESSFFSDNIDEGRAMLHIVHDLAPGANLAFATAVNGLFGFADNVRALQQARSDVIVDDIFYFDEPFYQDGPVSVAIQEVVTQGAMYFTAAGNSHTIDQNGNPIGSYEAAYRATACPPANSDALGIDCHAFNTAGNDPTMGMAIAPGGGLQMIFQWAQPWGGIETDLDIYLVNSSGNLEAGSVDTNNGPDGTQLPVEVMSYVNNTNETQVLNLVVARFDGPVVPALKYVLIRSAGVLATEYNGTNSTDTFGPTVIGHSMANAALSIAAIPFDDAETPEEFSSRGSATVYFGPTLSSTPAGPLPAPEVRQKPDIAATDGNRNSFFGEQENGVFRFRGTSAAAPHAAAVAALMRQRANQRGVTLNQFNGESILETTAASMANGTPSSVGAGRINAVNAIYGVEQIAPQVPVQYLPQVLK